MFLTGDHNMGGDANPPKTPFQASVATSSGTFAVSLGTNFNATAGPGWLDSLHSKQGNVGLADGSVQQMSRSRLQEGLRNTGDGGAASPGSFPLATGSTASINV